MKGTSEAERWTLIFDGECGICRRSMEWVRARDPGGRIEPVPFQSPDVAKRFPDLSAEALHRAMHLVAPSGQVWAGARAGEELLRILPRGRFWAMAFRIPGARWMADRIYAWVARNRRSLGCGDHCDLGAAPGTGAGVGGSGAGD